jgi:hypothetical protein
MFGDIVMGVDREEFEHILNELKARRAQESGKDPKEVRDTDLTTVT